MNFGVTSVAAPNAASSRTARYSSTARLGRVRRQARGTLDARCGRWRRPRSGWHRRQSPRRRPGPRRCSAAARSRTAGAADRCRGSGHAGSSRRSSGRAPSPSRPKPAEPAVGQVEVNLLAQPPLRADAEAVADDQHPDHQLRIDRRPADLAVERRQFLPQPVEVDEPVDRAQQVLRRAHAVRAKTRRTGPPAGRAVPPSSTSPRPQRPE